MENNINSRYSAAFILAAVGDALGWPNESRSNNLIKSYNKYETFQDWKRYTGGKYWKHQEIIKKGEYSDDTQLIISTARSLLRQKDWANNFYNIELPFWLEYERGGGRATRTAAKILKRGQKPWLGTTKELTEYFNAGGNGVAMRILPHVVYEQHNIKNLIGKVVINGMYTHGHPRALIGATCYAYALEIFSQKQDVLKYGELVEKLIEDKEIWTTFPNIERVEEWKKQFEKIHKNEFDIVWKENVDIIINELKQIRENLKRGVLDVTSNSLEKLGVFDKKIGGAGDITTVAAIYLASKYATDPQKAIIEAANLKGADTDTIASMTGALLGMLYGEEIIPIQWLAVQDCNFLRKLPQYLLDPTLYNKVEQNKDCKYINSPIGKITEEYSEINIRKQEKKVVTRKYQTVFGQSLYIKEYTKLKEEKQPNVINTEKIKKEILNIKELNHLNLKEYINCLYEILNGSREEDIIKKYKINNSIIEKIKKMYKN